MLLLAALLVSIAGTLAYPGGYVLKSPREAPGGYVLKSPREVLLVPQEEANSEDTTFYEPDTKKQPYNPKQTGWGSGGFLSNLYSPSNNYFSTDKDKGDRHIIHYPDGSMYELTPSGVLRPIGFGNQTRPTPEKPPTIVIIKVPYPVDHHHHPPPPRPRPTPVYPPWYHHYHPSWPYYHRDPHYHSYPYYHSHPHYYPYPQYPSYPYKKRPYVNPNLPQHSGYAPEYNYQSSESHYPSSYDPYDQQGEYNYGGGGYPSYYEDNSDFWSQDYRIKGSPTTTDSKTKEKGKFGGNILQN